MFFQKACCMGTDFFNLAENFYLRCENEDFMVLFQFLVSCGSGRSSLIHKGKFSHPNEVVREEMVVIDDLDSIQRQGHTHSSETGAVSPKSWTNPPENWVKVNCDAALDKTRGLFGMGVVVWDSDGRLLALKRLIRRGSVELVVVEGMAFYYGMNLCKAVGFKDIWLEGDAKLICDALNKRSTDNSRSWHLIEDIEMVLLSFNQWKCTHICREGNEAAHILAREALSWSGDRSWEDFCPDCIKQIISTEQMALA
jgi:ribonuclease HI